MLGATLPSLAAPACPVPTAFCPACPRPHPPGCLSLFPVTRFSAETASGCRAPGRCWASTCACPDSSGSTSQEALRVPWSWCHSAAEIPGGAPNAE